MKKITTIFCCLLLVACSESSSEINTEPEVFEFTATPSATTVNIDQLLTINLSAAEVITEVWPSFDNFQTGGFAQNGFGSNANIYFAFQTLGPQTLKIRCKNAAGLLGEKSITVNVVRGNAVKIKSIELLNFTGINTDLDTEFPAGSIDAKGDLRFGFQKIQIGNFRQSAFNYRQWYFSAVQLNQQSLFWNLENENLYVVPSSVLRFGAGEVDDEIGMIDFFMEAPYYGEINFSNYETDRPEFITITYPNQNVTIRVGVEWAN
jgi:hypothetical protein